jgi:hypothetical protein
MLLRTGTYVSVPTCMILPILGVGGINGDLFAAGSAVPDILKGVSLRFGSTGSGPSFGICVSGGVASRVSDSSHCDANNLYSQLNTTLAYTKCYVWLLTVSVKVRGAVHAVWVADGTI